MTTDYYTHGFDRLKIDCHFHLPTKFWPCHTLRLDTRRQDVKVEPLTKLYTLWHYALTKPIVSYTESLGCRPAWAKDFLSCFELLDSEQRSPDLTPFCPWPSCLGPKLHNWSSGICVHLPRMDVYPQYSAPPCISCLSDIQHSMVQVFILQMPTLQIICINLKCKDFVVNHEAKPSLCRVQRAIYLVDIPSPFPSEKKKCWRHVKCAKAKSLAAMETMGSSDVLKLFEARKDIFWDLRASGLPRMKGFVGGASAVRIKYNIQIRPDQ